MSAGIDYGMGRTNVNHATGIRFGAISQHEVSQAWSDSAEADYGPATCPQCGGTVADYDSDEHGELEQYGRGCADYACDSCGHTLDSGDAFGDEPIGWNYSGDGYELANCLDSDVMVISSPFYTFADYCSPCVPGAGNLQSHNPDGAKTYCLGHDWFEDGKAPYPVFSVETGAEIHPELTAA